MKKGINGIFGFLLFSVFVCVMGLILSFMDVGSPHSSSQSTQDSSSGSMGEGQNNSSQQGESSGQGSEGSGQGSGQVEKIELYVQFEPIYTYCYGDEINEIIISYDETLLLNGHTISFTSSNNTNNIGSFPLKGGFTILDSFSNDVSSLYNITSNISGAIVNVTKAPIKIDLANNNFNKVYDGKAFDLNNIKLIVDTILPVNVEFEAVSSTDLTTVGNHEISLNYIIRNQLNKNITDNFEIVGNNKINLTISEKTFSVNFSTLEKDYDGNVFDLNEFIKSQHGVLPNHNLTLNIDQEIKDVGDYTSTVIYHIFDENGTDVTSNYFLKTQILSLTINKRPISFAPIYLTKEYDNTTLNVLELLNVNSGSLLKGDNVELNNFKINEPGVYNNFDIKIMNNGIDVSKNYEILPLKVYIEITKPYIDFKLSQTEFIYSGNNLDLTNILYYTGNIGRGHKLQYDNSVANMTNVGNYAISVRARVYDELGYDVTSYYNINDKNLNLTIKPIEVTYDMTKLVFNYTGNPIMLDKFITITSNNLIQGHNPSVMLTKSSVQHVGRYIIGASLRIKNTSGEDVTSNYKIIDKTFEVNVLPIDLDININLPIYTYSEKFINNFINDIDIELSRINPNIKFDKLKFMSNFNGANTYVLDSSYIIMEDKENYNIKFSEIVVVNKGQLTINTDKLQYNVIYNGKDFKLDPNSLYFMDNGIRLNNVTVNNILTNKINEAIIDTPLNIISYDISIDGIDIKNLYDIDMSKLNITVTVNKLKLSLKCDPITVTVLDETIITKDVIRNSLNASNTAPLINGHFIDDFKFSIDKLTNKVKVFDIVIKNSNNEIVTSCYDFNQEIFGDIYII